MRRLYAEERANALVLFAVIAPLFILFLALALDVGNWFTHKRQLQSRADAAALAAGVEYQKRLPACIGSNAAQQTTAASAISQIAKQYAGDPNGAVPGPKYNISVTNQGSLTVAVNSSSYSGADNSDGGNTCFIHAANASDWVSPSGGIWTDVKVKESNVPTFFGGFGVPVPGITARARVELHPATSDNGSIPIGVPDPRFEKAQARFINECDGTLLKKVDLAPLLDANQTLGNDGLTLWGPTSTVTSPPTPVAPSQITLSPPTGPTCRGGGSDGNGYIPVGVEVRVGSKTDSTPDIDGPTCATLVTTKYADCWTDLTEIRYWKDGDPTTGPPVFRNVNLLNSGPACKYDPYFTSITACSLTANVDVQWGDRPGSLSDTSHVTYSVKLNGVSLTPTAGKSGIWSANTGFFGAGLPAGGASNVTLDWSWEDKNPADSFRGQACQDHGPNPCKGNGSLPVHRTFTTTDDTTGPVKLVQVSNSSTAGTTASLFDSANVGGSPVSVYLNLGFQAAYETQAPGSTLVTLRADDSQGTHSLNCDTKNQGDDFQEFAIGCTKWYTPNTYASGFWWLNQSPHGCPDANSIYSQANDSGANAWQCIDTAPGATANTVACGIALRTGNAPGANPNGNNCNPGDLQCVHPNLYSTYMSNGQIDPGDPRIVHIIIVPWGAFKGVNGSTDAVPVILVGAFYITGWGANGSKKDPCSADDPAQPGEVIGRFIKLAEINNGPVDIHANCDPNSVTPCRIVLVR